MIRFLINLLIIVLLISMVSCGKSKVSIPNTRHELSANIPDTNHRVDIVYSIDIDAITDAFTPICERKFKSMPDGAEKDDAVALCVDDAVTSFLDALAASTPEEEEEEEDKSNGGKNGK